MPSAGATSSATDTPYTVSPAVELEAALCDPKREPLSAFYHWVLLDPPSQLKNDPIELKEIYNTIAELWNRIRDNRVRNREDLERWQTEAQDIELRHGLLLQRHHSLRDNPWMGRVNTMLAIVPILLEKSCERCVKKEMPCYMPPVVGRLPESIKPTCLDCRRSRGMCSWAHHIPGRFYHLKYAIKTDDCIPEGAADPTGPDTAVEHPGLDFSAENLGQLLRVTETAIAEVDVKVCEMLLQERLKLCEGLEEVYNA